MKPTLAKIFILLFIYYCSIRCSNLYSSASDISDVFSSASRYLLYDVNTYEGFNLRRDVYMRLAVFVNNLNRGSVKWQLVLPPWNQLPHWRSKSAGNQRLLPWSLFFDLKSLQSYVPVIEAYEFFEDNPNTPLDHVFILQHYRDLWSENFTWTDKWDVEECRQTATFRRTESGLFKGSTLGFQDIFAKNFHCVSFQGPASLLKNILGSLDGNSVLIEHAEIILHDFYGSIDYWKCRRSMKFSNDLIKLAMDFKQSVAISFRGKVENIYIKGDPYLCVHFRRRDYIRSRPTHIPSVNSAAHQIKQKLVEYNLTSVFVATDTTEEEFEELSRLLLPYKTIRYEPSPAVLQKYKDGGIAIIEQIICSHARYFVGSFESTFSFRIQEERELLNMDPDTTFNRLCGDTENNCQQPTRWRLVQ